MHKDHRCNAKLGKLIVAGKVLWCNVILLLHLSCLNLVLFVCLFLQTPEEGASTSIYAAVSPEMEGAGGCYLYNEERTKSADIAYDEELQRRLWTESCKMVGISDEFSRVP